MISILDFRFWMKLLVMAIAKYKVSTKCDRKRNKLYDYCPFSFVLSTTTD
ncbi:MAG: hypothetical protein RMX68_026165 [Aulosira sp. ZfuVER01]|nr:hypothetical protein [Aulosira sp. DedVER01a]